MLRFFVALLLAVPLSAAEYHIDFARWFPPVETQRTEFAAALKRVEAYRGGVTRSAASVKSAIDAYSAALFAMERLDAYLYLRYAVDTRQTDMLHEEEALGAEFDRRTAFFNNELSQLPDARVQRLLSSKTLRRYAYFVERARRTGGRLTLSQEDVVNRVAPVLTGWPDELYEALDARKETSRDLYAFALFGLVRARTALAELHRFPDAASEVYARDGLTREDSRRLLAAVAEEAPRYAAFRRVRAASPVIDSKVAYTLDEARVTLRDALAPLGDRYRAELADLLNPASGRMDITAGDHRKRGGFSKGFPGMTSVFYMSGFKGTYNDMRIIAHEGTHAVQRAMQSKSGVLPVYASAPSFLMEAMAIVPELLLPAYLYEHESDASRKRFFLDQLLTSKGWSVLFQAAAEGDLEERIYDGVTRGDIRNSGDLDALTVATFARYGIEAPPEQWTKIRLMFEDPFYDINYTWAAVIALPLFRQAQSASIAQKYGAGLSSGFEMPARDWLKKFLAVDIRDPGLVHRALDALQPYVDAYSSSNVVVPAASGISEIRLERDCSGCPTSSLLVLRRDGRASYTVTGNARFGASNVQSGGVMKGGDFEQLAALMTSQGFFALLDEYDDPQLQDGRTTIITAIGDGKEKRVVSKNESAPEALAAIEKSIDSLSERIKFIAVPSPTP